MGVDPDKDCGQDRELKPPSIDNMALIYRGPDQDAVGLKKQAN